MSLFIAYDDHGEPEYYILSDNIQQAKDRLKQECRNNLYICPVSGSKVLFAEGSYVQS